MINNDDEQLNIYDDIDQPDEIDKTADIVDDELAEQEDVETDSAVVKKRGKVEVAVNVVLWVAIIALAVMVVLRLFVFNSVRVDGESMTPTYASDEIVVVNKVTTPKRGDVVVFYLNDVDSKLKAMFASEEQCGAGQPYEKLIKRVVATEGDKIWVRRVDNGSSREVCYEVVVDTADGNRLTENYYVRQGETLPYDRYYIYERAATGLGVLANCTESNPYVVSKGCFFAMGDHRENSVDSRTHGEFPLTRLFGVVLDK